MGICRIENWVKRGKRQPANKFQSLESRWFTFSKRMCNEKFLHSSGRMFISVDLTKDFCAYVYISKSRRSKKILCKCHIISAVSF